MKKVAEIGREVLPIPDRQHVGLTTYDAKDPDTKYHPSSRCGRPRARQMFSSSCLTTSALAHQAHSAVRVIRHSGTLAAAGLKYNRFHTTALCSPTRQALLTGRNHHTVGMGGVTEMATSAPGNS